MIVAANLISLLMQNQALVYAKTGPSRIDVKFKVDTGSQADILPLKHYQAL